MGDLVAEVLALTGIGGAHAGIVSELSLGRQPLDEAVERAEVLGNPLLQAWADSQQAVACAFSGDLDATEAWASAGERRLHTVGSAIGAREFRLTQGNVVGGVITFAQAYARSQRADSSPWLVALPDMAARAAAAGYLLTPSLLEISYAVTMTHRGDHAAAEQSLARCRESAERSGAEATLVNAAAYWCDLALAAGDLEEAKRRLASVERRTLAERSMHARVRLGLRRAAVALIEGEIDAAEREAHDALSICVREGIAWETFHALEVLAQVAMITDSPSEAARIAGAVGAIRAQHDINVRLAWHAERFDRSVVAARAALGDEAFERCYAEGFALSATEAAAYVQRARGERKRPSFGWDGLTPTEREVVGHVAEGRTNPQIAEAMFISRETVKTHLSHIFAKLNVTPGPNSPQLLCAARPPAEPPVRSARRGRTDLKAERRPPAGGYPQDPHPSRWGSHRPGHIDGPVPLTGPKEKPWKPIDRRCPAHRSSACSSECWPSWPAWPSARTKVTPRPPGTPSPPSC